MIRFDRNFTTQELESLPWFYRQLIRLQGQVQTMAATIAMELQLQGLLPASWPPIIVSCGYLGLMDSALSGAKYGEDDVELVRGMANQSPITLSARNDFEPPSTLLDGDLYWSSPRMALLKNTATGARLGVKSDDFIFVYRALDQVFVPADAVIPGINEITDELSIRRFGDALRNLLDPKSGNFIRRLTVSGLLRTEFPPVPADHQSAHTVSSTSR